MKQDTLKSYVIAGSDTYVLDGTWAPAHIRVFIEPELTAFDTMQPHEPVVFNAEPPMAEQLSYLLEVKPKPSEPSYPMNSKFQGASVALAIIMIGVVAVKLHLLYAKFCHSHSRPAGSRLR